MLPAWGGIWEKQGNCLLIVPFIVFFFIIYWVGWNDKLFTNATDHMAAVTGTAVVCDVETV